MPNIQVLIILAFKKTLKMFNRILQWCHNFLTQHYKIQSSPMQKENLCIFQLRPRHILGPPSSEIKFHSQWQQTVLPSPAAFSTSPGLVIVWLQGKLGRLDEFTPVTEP